MHVAPRDRHAMGRHGLRVAAVSHVQRLLQNRLDPGGEGRVRMVLVQRVTPAEQMRQTGLRDRSGELPIRGPAVADQDAVIVGAEHRGGLGKAASRVDRVHGRVRRGRGPQPLERRRDLPPGFIRGDDEAVPHRVHQRVVGGLGAPGRARCSACTTPPGVTVRPHV